MFPLPPSLFRLSWPLLLASAWLGLGAFPARAVVLYDTDNALANTTAPTGIYADSGWAWQGEYGGYLGTMIAPQYFITAQHFGPQGSTFVSTAEFNGVADITYTIDAAANGGQGYWDIAGTDLRIIKINETFADYAQLYTGSSEVGLDLVTFGRGGPRGSEVLLGGDSKGWLHTGSDLVSRWGANEISAVVSSNVGSLLTATFSNISGQNEATLSAGDSGGGVFVFASGQWWLAGVNYGVDGFFDTNDTIGDSSHFSAALFDKGGFYEGRDATGWVENPDIPINIASRMYASRISDSTAAIATITGVPEPAGLCLVLLSSVMLLARRRSSNAV